MKTWIWIAIIAAVAIIGYFAGNAVGKKSDEAKTAVVVKGDASTASSATGTGTTAKKQGMDISQS